MVLALKLRRDAIETRSKVPETKIERAATSHFGGNTVATLTFGPSSLSHSHKLTPTSSSSSSLSSSQVTLTY